MRKILKSLLCFILLCTAATSATAQEITINGFVTDKSGQGSLLNIMVIDQQSGNGSFASANGTFTIKVQRKDTIMVTARDYAIKKICFRDSSVAKTEYTIKIRLDSLHFELIDVYIRPQASLPQIHKNIEDLGKVQNTDTYKDVAYTSPITLLYERFSRIEQSKRKVAQMEDDDNRRKVLKDLLHLYIKYDIIKLDDKSFDNFIDYCELSDEFIKKSTDYELIMAIKQKYQRYIRNYGTDYYNK